MDKEDYRPVLPNPPSPLEEIDNSSTISNSIGELSTAN